MRKKKAIAVKHKKDNDVMALEKTVGENVRRFRKLKGLSQQDLANKTALKQASISNLEAGKRGFSSNVLTKVAKVLDVHPGMLFFPVLE